MYLITIGFIILFNNSECARILGVFSVPSKSHQAVFRPLMQELAQRGHDVVVITTDPQKSDQNPQNLKEVDVGGLSYKIRKTRNLLTFSKSRVAEIEKICRAYIVIIEEQLKTDVIQELVKTEEFDLLIWECPGRMSLVLAHLFNIPVIGIVSFGGYGDLYDVVGANDHPILNPKPFTQKFINLTTLQTIGEVYNFYALKYMHKKLEITEDERLKEVFGDKIPELKEMKSRMRMLFLNNHPLWDFNRPVPRSVLYLNHLSEKASAPLPEDLKNYLDSSTNGVIYLCFGTSINTDLFSNDTVKIFTNVFSKLPYDVLMKWDSELPGQSKNIKTSKWLPQSDLLMHPKIKLFITQGGLQATDEAISAGVPLIGIPMRADQWYNAQKYVHHGIGVQLDMVSLTEETFMNAIENVIENDSYRQNIIKLRNIMKDQPNSSVERAALWTEYILRTGNTDLRSPAAGLHWAEYYEIELFLYGFVILTLIVYLFVYCLKIVIKLFLRKSQTKILKKVS